MRKLPFLALTALVISACGEKTEPVPETVPESKPESAAVETTAEPAEKSGVSALFPEKLETPTGEIETSDALDGKMVAVYFSADWCGPCKALTPKVVELYKKHADDDFEMVLINLDYSEEEKAAYIKKSGIAFPVFPGINSEEIAAFSNKYRARKLPTILVFSPDGELVTKDGVTDLRENEAGAVEQWKQALAEFKG